MDTPSRPQGLWTGARGLQGPSGRPATRGTPSGVVYYPYDREESPTKQPHHTMRSAINHQVEQTRFVISTYAPGWSAVTRMRSGRLWGAVNWRTLCTAFAAR